MRSAYPAGSEDKDLLGSGEVNWLDMERYISETYGTAGERLFAKHPGFCVFRHLGNRKWFAVLMEIPRAKLGLPGGGVVCVVNVKCDERLIGSFRMEPGIYPAYHMSKAHWLTLALDGTVPDDKLKFLLEMSYGLTRGKAYGNTHIQL